MASAIPGLSGRDGVTLKIEVPADHIAVELGFAGYLAMKQAYALTSGDRAGARPCGGCGPAEPESERERRR